MLGQEARLGAHKVGGGVLGTVSGAIDRGGEREALRRLRLVVKKSASPEGTFLSESLARATTFETLLLF